MKPLKIALVFLMVVLLIAGCVPSKKYKASLADISALEKNVASLEENLNNAEVDREVFARDKTALLKDKSGLEAELSGLRVRHEGLEAELSGLRARYEGLDKEKTSLSEENSDLKKTLESKKDELIKEITALRAKLTEEKQKISRIEAELKANDMFIAELKAEVEGLSKGRSIAIEEKEKAITELKGTYENLVDELKGEIKRGEIEVTQLRDKLTLSMVEKILFDSGSAEIKKEGEAMLKRVGEILKKVSGRQIKIEGHTDNVPISSRLRQKFPTNWELSTARATNVVRYLQESAGLNPAYLSASGYAEHRQLESNETAEGRAKNRRIEILLIPIEAAVPTRE